MIAIESKKRFYLLTFSITFVLGGLLLSIAEGISLSDAYYFCLVTMSTVGYGDIAPETTIGRLISVVVILVGVATFLAFVGNLTEIALNKKEREIKKQKINILVGVYLKEIGKEILRHAEAVIVNYNEIQKILMVTPEWTAKEFIQAEKAIEKMDVETRFDAVVLDLLEAHVMHRRDTISRLLENRYVLDNEHFSDVMLSSLHLLDEIGARESLHDLPEKDQEHLANDFKRVYDHLIRQWLNYLRHLQEQYPYLYSLEIRTNPFNPNAKSVIE